MTLYTDTRTIQIEVSNGVVTDVLNLPDDWDYELEEVISYYCDTIQIEVSNGVVIDVLNLPDDWHYEIIDHDVEEVDEQ